MLDMIGNTLMVNISITVNKLILFLKSIPLLGKKIPSSLYKIHSLKLLFLIIGISENVIINLFYKSLYVIALIWLPARYMDNVIKELFSINLDVPFMPTAVFLFFVLNCVFGSLSNVTVMSSNDEKFYMIRLLRSNPKEYYLSAIIQKIFLEIIGFIIPLSIMFYIETDKKYGIGLALLLILIQGCFRIMLEAFWLKIYAVAKFDSGHQGIIRVVYGFVLICSAFIIPTFTEGAPIMTQIISSYIFPVLCIAGAVFSWIYLNKFDKYSQIAAETLTYAKVLAGIEAKNKVQNSNIEMVKYNDKALKKQKIDERKFAHKTGYNYLNAIFFDRHRYSIQKGWLIKLSILSIGIAASAIVIVLLGGSKDLEFRNKDISAALGVFLFSFYCLNSVENTCKIMFYHCDHALLKYGYYREPGALLKCYLIRLKKILSMDMFIALFVDAGIVLLMALNKTLNFSVIWPIIISLPLEMMFIDMFRLMMYYVFQPFCEQGQMRSAMYKFCNVCLYVFCYTGTRVRTDSFVYAYVIMGICILFIPLSQILVYKLAPRGFRLKD